MSQTRSLPERLKEVDVLIAKGQNRKARALLNTIILELEGRISRSELYDYE